MTRIAAAAGLFVVATLIGLPRSAPADETLEGIACRSVHLAYDAPESTAYYNEVTVEQSAPGTYVCVGGFQMGYFGLQELGRGKKVLIFSVWEPDGKDDPDAVAEDRRVQLVHRDEAVRVGRFGNEGTGGQSFLDFDWQVGQTYRFLVTARVVGDRTEYSGHFFHPGRDRWVHLVTFSTLNRGRLLRGGYAFLEDFRRNKVSATQPRRARFGPGWARTKAGDWEPLNRARFTADANPALNIDAGVVDGRFYLATGGATENLGARLRDRIEPSPEPGTLPADVRDLVASIEARATTGG